MTNGRQGSRKFPFVTGFLSLLLFISTYGEAVACQIKLASDTFGVGGTDLSEGKCGPGYLYYYDNASRNWVALMDGSNNNIQVRDVIGVETDWGPFIAAIEKNGGLIMRYGPGTNLFYGRSQRVSGFNAQRQDSFVYPESLDAVTFEGGLVSVSITVNGGESCTLTSEANGSFDWATWRCVQSRVATGQIAGIVPPQPAPTITNEDQVSRTSGGQSQSVPETGAANTIAVQIPGVVYPPDTRPSGNVVTARTVDTSVQQQAETTTVARTVRVSYPAKARSMGGSARSGPGNRFRWIFDVEKNAPITVLQAGEQEGSGNVWFKISHAGKSGYLLSGDICSTAQPIPGTMRSCSGGGVVPDTGVETADTAGSSGPTTIRTGSQQETGDGFPHPGRSRGASIRSGPGTKHGVIGDAPGGADITLLERKGSGRSGHSWFKIQYGSKTGYAWGQLLCSQGRKVIGTSGRC